MYLKEEVTMGPGLTRIKSSVLDDPIALLGFKNDFRDMLDQIPQSQSQLVYDDFSPVHLPHI